MYRSIQRVLLVLSLLTLMPLALGATLNEVFLRGVHEFRAGHYSIALQAFEQARQQGLDTSNLHYDLAGTLFRLQRYEAAAQEFRALLGIPGLDGLIHYNLALVALKEHRIPDARRELRLAETQSDSPQIADLAGKLLSTLEIIH